MSKKKVVIQRSRLAEECTKLDPDFEKAMAEDGVDDAWDALADKRYSELESGAVKGVSWQAIKDAL